MLFNDITLRLGVQLDGWKGWPFTGYGFEGGILPSIARAAFVLLILVAIALFLRFLFGPKGRFRGEGWETMQEAREREARQAAGSPENAGGKNKAEGKDKVGGTDRKDKE